MRIDTVAAVIAETRRSAEHPIAVGISGFGGSGKSTLARRLTERLGSSLRMRGDDFLDPSRSHRRSSSWEGVERTRLARDVLIPFREQRDSMFQRFDWSTRGLGVPEPVPRGEILLVDLIGLFHPETRGALDLRIWCDVDLGTATERGLARDARRGRDHVTLWNDVWVPNERDFVRHFAPRSAADVLFSG